MKRIILSILLFIAPAIALAAPFTVGKIPKAKTGTYLMDSSIYETAGGLVGIGTTDPQGELDVDGVLYATTFYGNGSHLTGITSTETDPVWESEKSGYLTAESDPKVGTLTNTKWCVTNGSVINCTEDEPVTIVDLSAVDQGIYPDTDNVYDIGSVAKSWNEIYADGTITAGNLVTSGTSKVSAPTVDVDFATYGSYSVGVIATSGGSVVPTSAQLVVDGAVYVKGTAIYIRQSDGGCTKITSAADGTSLTAVNIACSGNM